MRTKLKKVPILKLLVVGLRQLRHRHSRIKRFKLLISFWRDYKKYQTLPENKEVPTTTENLYPCIFDKTENTPVDPIYFYQDSWCAGKVFQNRPKDHYDIASHAHMVGIISQFTPTVMIDIRPIALSMDGLSFIKGNITQLPFKDNEIESLSSICVIEHIGLGRYGDPLDPHGSEKAAKELVRVLAPQGNLYVSIPIDSQTKVYFNAHRAFTREYALKMFEGLDLVEEKYIYHNSLVDTYRPDGGFGTGLFHFRK